MIGVPVKDRRLWDIWIEGHIATGERSFAQRVARGVPGVDFRDACVRHCSRLDPEYWGEFDSERLTLWGCYLYPTEEQARKSYG